MHHQSNQFDISERRNYIKINETKERNYIKLTPKEEIKIYPDDYEAPSVTPEVPETEEVKIYEKIDRYNNKFFQNTFFIIV